MIVVYYKDSLPRTGMESLMTRLGRKGKKNWMGTETTFFLQNCPGTLYKRTTETYKLLYRGEKVAENTDNQPE